jgi:hypothetical protein
MSKKSLVLFLIVAAAALALFGGVSANAAGKTSSTRVVPIVMHDPGCHWFQVNGKFSTKLTVSGATSFRNLDEATLIFKGTSFSKLLPVGKMLTITKAGLYHITMVGQASDDNHLVLTVR